MPAAKKTAATSAPDKKKRAGGIKRVVVVGCGGMGRAWIENVKKNPRCLLVGVVDVRAEAAAAAAKDFGLAPEAAFTDLKKAIAATSPDFVCDITIPEAHCTTTVTALGQGVPVIGEKPLASSMAEAKKMRKAAEAAGKLYMVSQSRRYDGVHIPMAEALKKGVIGDVTTLNCDFYIGAHFGGFRDEMDSPLVLDMAIHHFDMARFFTGADPVNVYAREFNPKGSWYKGDVATSIIFEMTNGIIFTYRGSWCAEGMGTSWNGDWRIVGTKGTLIAEKDQAPKGQIVKKGGKHAFFSELEDITVAKKDLGDAGGIHSSLNEFLDALASGKTPQCEVHDNIKSLAMVFAAIESSRSGKLVKVAW